jgi:hypothetical protein
MIGNNEGLTILINKALEAQNSDHYYSLYTNLKTICIATDDVETMAELDAFFDSVPIILDKMEYYYRIASENPGSRRKIVFSDIGSVTFEEIMGMYNKFVVIPLNLIAARMLGKVMQSKGFALQKAINAKAASFLNDKDAPKEPEIILD